MKRLFFLCLVFSLTTHIVRADSITSTTAGGPWAEPATWTGGVVPGLADDVTLVGPVSVAGNEACRDLTVSPDGKIAAHPSAPNSSLTASGSVVNQGLIEEGSYNFTILVGGDLENAGTWASRRIHLTGSADRTLTLLPGGLFDTDIVMAEGAAGDVLVSVPLTVTGNVDMTGGRMVLGPDCPFTLIEGAFSGELLAGGNELRCVSWSYLDRCTLDDVVLVGEVEAAILVNFTTRVTVMDVLQNLSSTGGSAVTIEGDLINHGTIQNNHYGFAVRLYGDLENNGAITCSQLEFMGTAEHHLSMSPDALLDTNVFLPEFQARTLVADTPVRFADGLGLGIGTLILQPGCSLQFTDFGSVGSGYILANGNEIRVDGTGAIGSVTIDQAVIGGSTQFMGDVVFTGGLTVAGMLASWTYDSAEIRVEGLLHNTGTIADGAHPVTITAEGDLVNEGTWNNTRLVMAGDQDQQMAIGTGIDVPECVLDSRLTSSSYQWFKDGSPLDGATEHDLTLNTVGPADHGTYHCEGDGGAVSRTVTITEQLGISAVPEAGRGRLAQNRPNPFNPATIIAFALDREEHTRLTIYDLAGREVAVLVEGSLTPGAHQVAWQPEGLPSGVYCYRLQTPTVDIMRKCTLLK